MLFSELLSLAQVPHKRHGRDVEVTGLTDDSRRCEAAGCFVAVRGCGVDGHDYIESARKLGAVAIVCEDAAGLDDDFPCAVVSDTRQVAGKLAQAIAGFPARKLTTVAVTGTNGKTTVMTLIRAIIESAGLKCGSLGTVTYDSGSSVTPAVTTTPGAIELARLAGEMVSAGCSHLVMEVSSHALDQDRAAGINFDVGVFTNLSGDHLDYHKTAGAYLLAKRKLFESLDCDATAVINHDDSASQAMADATDAKVMWYGLDTLANLHAHIERIDAAGTQFTMICGDERTVVTTPLIGHHNVLNCLAAAGAAAALGIDLATIASALGKISRVPGRLERVDSPAPFKVFVDYAHTDDALENVLQALDPLRSGGRVILVFGCGGDRDRTKRPRMARIAQKYADRIVITSDNPRSEDPDKIITEVAVGLDAEGREKTELQADRREAIVRAVEMACEGDIVLIAGKGHENYQIIGDRRIHFNDVEEARLAMAARGDE